MIKSNTPATNKQWDSMVSAAESAVYFQTREWFELWSEYAGFRNDARLICFDSGKKVLLPLTRMAFLKGLLNVCFLAPKGTGGFVTNDALDEDEKHELFDVLKKITLLYCAVNPYDILTNEFDRFNATEFTQVLDLSEGFEGIFKKWSDGHHKRTRKGLREGITVEVATREDDWRAYFTMYQDTLARWGEKATNRYGWDLFERMYKRKSTKIRLWLAKYEGRLISGALNFYHNRHVAGWHGASSPYLYKKLNANHVLEYCMIKDACERGFLLYDFLPSAGIEGVIHFKTGFSPQQRRVNIYMSRAMKIFSPLRGSLRNTMLYRPLMRGKGD